MSVLNVYPGSIGVNNPVSGFLQNGTYGYPETWSALHDDISADLASFTGQYILLTIRAGTPNDTDWVNISRPVICFDTSSLGVDAVITAATLSLYKYDAYYGTNGETRGYDINVVSAAPASTNELVAGDTDSLGTTPFSTLYITNMGNGAVGNGRKNFELNAAGIANINKTGITKLGLRFTHDMNDDVPPWYDADYKSASFRSQNYGANTYWPLLQVTYSLVMEVVIPDAPTITISGMALGELGMNMPENQVELSGTAYFSSAIVREWPVTSIAISGDVSAGMTLKNEVNAVIPALSIAATVSSEIPAVCICILPALRLSAEIVQDAETVTIELPALEASAEITQGDAAQISGVLPSLEVNAELTEDGTLYCSAVLAALRLSAEIAGADGFAFAIELPALTSRVRLAQGDTLVCDITMPALSAEGNVDNDESPSITAILPSLYADALIQEGVL